MNGNICILIQISLEFVPGGLIDNKAAPVQVKAWHWTSGKPLPGAMQVKLSDAYMRHYGETSLKL